MNNGKWIMENEGVASGDMIEIILKKIPQLSIIHYQLSIKKGEWFYVGP